MSDGRPLVIGVAGGTGSGKSTIADAMVAATRPGLVQVLPQDVYYKRSDDPVFRSRAVINYDEPSAFDTPLLVAQIDDLIAGRAIARPIYDFAASDRSEATVPVEPSPVLIVEGILVLHEPELRSRMSLKVFVDAPPDERFIRRLERDVNERGRSAVSVIEQYRTTVKPMHDLYVEPTKQHADIIVPEGGDNQVAIEVLADHVRAFVTDRAENVDAVGSEQADR